MSFDVPEVTSDECPVSVITPESMEMLRLDMRNRQVKESTGACIFGPDAGRWPAWWVDAVSTIESQRALTIEAMRRKDS